jgi:hypothetical protein
MKDQLYYQATDDISELSAERIVTGRQLQMEPGQKLKEKAAELGCSLPTLKIWTAEWRGAQYDPDYVIVRSGHSNWMLRRWRDKDWCEELRHQIAEKRHRHIGDLLLELRIPTSTAHEWSKKHVEFGDILWKQPHPRNHWPRFLSYVRHSTIGAYHTLKAAHLATGMTEKEACHRAADEAINELRHKTAQRQRWSPRIGQLVKLGST